LPLSREWSEEGDDFRKGANPVNTCEYDYSEHRESLFFRFRIIVFICAAGERKTSSFQ
jgi:hypothetical protein